MHDKTFQQAIEDLQGRLSSGFQETVCRMIEYRTTVTRATSDIQDEKVRSVVKKTLIVGQMITSFGILRDMQIINEAQYNEFATYLIHTITYHPNDS
jgi:hypothetical protein